MVAIIIRIFKQMLNDKRALAMILLAPLFIMSFMYLVLGDSPYIPKVSTYDTPAPIVEKLANQDLELISSDKPVEQQLKDGIVDAVIFTKDNKMHIQLLEPNNTIAQKVKTALINVNQEMNVASNNIDISFVFGDPNASTFDGMIHVLLGIYSFFLVFLISGIAFVREQTIGTMERFMLTPINRFAVVSGFIIGYGIFAVIQSALLILFVTFILNITISGSIIGIMMTMTLLSFIAIATGALISGLAKNEFQVIQFIPLILTPQIFFSGLIPIATLPYGLGTIAKFMPLQYAVSALNKMINQSGTLLSITNELFILLIFLVVLFLANVIALKKYRAL